MKAIFVEISLVAAIICMGQIADAIHLLSTGGCLSCGAKLVRGACVFCN